MTTPKITVVEDVILKTDLHVHLYGCLYAQDVWELGRDRVERQSQRLAWYEDSSAAAWGRRPSAAEYWKSENGHEDLARDYVISGPVDFPKFQASFNLLIALFPMAVGDTVVLERVLSSDQRAGLLGAEYRTLLPVALGDADLDLYLLGLAKVILAHRSKTFRGSLAMSLPRDPLEAEAAYSRLRGWMDARPDFAPAISGIDFCGFEENDEPTNKISLFERVAADNLNRKNRLTVLLHVGETWETVSPLTSLRRVWEATQMPINRIGHGTIAGFLLESSDQTERLLHVPPSGLDFLKKDIAWIKHIFTQAAGTKNAAALAALLDTMTQLAASRGQLSSSPKVLPILLEAFRCLQHFVLACGRGAKTVFESCPVSNMRIARISPATAHPLPQFLAAGVKVIIGRDDPGIFGTTFHDEVTWFKKLVDECNSEALCRQSERHARAIFFE